jgi:hypothetical protein
LLAATTAALSPAFDFADAVAEHERREYTDGYSWRIVPFQDYLALFQMITTIPPRGLDYRRLR